MVAVDRKFKSFGSRLEEAEKNKRKRREFGLGDWWTKHKLNWWPVKQIHIEKYKVDKASWKQRVG